MSQDSPDNAAGTGAGAAIEAERFLAELENRAYPGLTRD